MKRKGALGIALAVVMGSLLGTMACSRNEPPAEESSPTKEAQDQKTREKVADATQKIKEKSEELGQEMDTAAQKLEEKAKVVAQGVKEGLSRDKYPLDLNSATTEQLQGLPGLNAEGAQKIIQGRPYKGKRELVTRHVLTAEQYRRLSTLVTVK